MKTGANSGKKQRLKLQVTRSTQRSATKRTPRENVTVESQPAHDFRLKGIPKDLFTVFHVREAGYEVEKRITAARHPLQHRGMQVDELQLYQEVVSVPMRPAWDERMKARRLHHEEEASFERYLSDVYARYPPTRLNHFEHNLHVWRQLWRVCEMSDMLVLCLDARHPLFHLPPSLLQYITAVLHKEAVLVLNKVDLIDMDTLQGWEEWLARRYPAEEVVRFSSFPNGSQVVSDAIDEGKRRKERKRDGAGGAVREASGVKEMMALLDRKLKEKLERVRMDEESKAGKESNEAAVDSASAVKPAAIARRPRGREREKRQVDAVYGTAAEVDERKKGDVENGVAIDMSSLTINDSDGVAGSASHRRSRRHARLTNSAVTPTDTSSTSAQPAVPLSQDAAGRSASSSDEDELVTLRPLKPSRPSRSSVLVVGVIGHPNVGKSSFINGLFGRAVVSASDTPGHTKHLQTLALTPQIAVLDCPGLVFPAVDMPRELQVLCGIFPITQLSEPYSSVRYLAERVPLDTLYGLKRSRDSDDVDDAHDGLTLSEDEHSWSAWALCEAFARQRNFTLAGGGGRVDTYKAANAILQDVLHGVVVFNFKAPTLSPHQHA